MHDSCFNGNNEMNRTHVIPKYSVVHVYTHTHSLYGMCLVWHKQIDNYFHLKRVRSEEEEGRKRREKVSGGRKRETERKRVHNYIENVSCFSF